MIYHYICTKCKNKKNVEFPMGTAPKQIKCDCGENMEQDLIGKLKTIQTNLPEDYKAMSDYHSIDYGDDENMKQMLSM